MTSQPWIPVNALNKVVQMHYELQWSHDLSAMDTVCAATGAHRNDRFNGAMTFQPWIRRSRPRWQASRIRFNGAMTFQPWIQVGSKQHLLKFYQLQWSHDLSAMDTTGLPIQALQHQACFNGAMTFQPWIHDVIRHRVASPIGLQWSHDLSAMDTACADVIACNARMLQWSHDLSAMDTTACTAHPR